MKSQEGKRKRIFDTGFIDPYQINEVMVNTPKMRKHTEAQLLKYFMINEFKRKILFTYNFRWECYCLVHIHFFLLDVMCNWWVTDVYINVRSFHFILLVIEPNFGRVNILDSKKIHKEFQSIIDMLER